MGHSNILTFAPDGRNLWASRQTIADQSCTKSMAGILTLSVSRRSRAAPYVAAFPVPTFGLEGWTEQVRPRKRTFLCSVRHWQVVRTLLVSVRQRFSPLRVGLTLLTETCQ